MAHMTNPLATAEQLYQRNNLSALPNDLQDVILYVTQSLTQAAGVLLQLPQSATAQANVILARYWLAESRPLLTTEFSVSVCPCPDTDGSSPLTLGTGRFSRLCIPRLKDGLSTSVTAGYLKRLRLPAVQQLVIHEEQGRSAACGRSLVLLP